MCGRCAGRSQRKLPATTISKCIAVICHVFADLRAGSLVYLLAVWRSRILLMSAFLISRKDRLTMQRGGISTSAECDMLQGGL